MEIQECGGERNRFGLKDHVSERSIAAPTTIRRMCGTGSAMNPFRAQSWGVTVAAQGRLSATSSAGWLAPPTGMTMYCRPLTM